jgi:hypothetical protein
LNAAQARGAATVVGFLDAYNAGRLEAALALMADRFVWSDCDYGKGSVVNGVGKESATAWLRERFADHDQLTLAGFYFGVPNEVGMFAVAVSYQRRTSDTLRSLGFPDGITPLVATKAGVTKDGDRLLVFANGPSGGPQDPCHPSPR